jgi:arylformamidase
MAVSTERAALDANYDLRAAVPEHEDYFARYERDSAAFIDAWPHRRLDLAYGDTARQAIDLFLPAAGATDLPLLVFIHGGYWQRFDRKAFAFTAAPLVARGAAVALIGYDLAPTVTMDVIVGQLRAGLAWSWRNARTLGVDPGRLHIAGHSAGGHLVAMALATDWAADFGLPAEPIAGAVTISGLFDLEPIRRCYLNDVLGMDEAMARRNSPLHLPAPGRCPVLVTVGGRETPAFLEQSDAYAAKLAAGDRPCELLVQADLDHFAIVMAMAEPAATTVQAIAEQMGLEHAG